MTWAEAAQLPLCLLTGDMQNRRILDGIFHEAGAEPRPTVETNSISTIFAHVRDGPWSSVMAHAWLHVFDVPDGMRAIPLVAPDDDAHDRPRLARSRSRVDPRRAPCSTSRRVSTWSALMDAGEAQPRPSQ